MATILEDKSALVRLVHDLRAIRGKMLKRREEFGSTLATIHPSHQPGAANLLDLLALRQVYRADIRERLDSIGVASLDDDVSDIEARIRSALGLVSTLCGALPDGQELSAFDQESHTGILKQHTDALLGEEPPGRSGRIMVTSPDGGADDYAGVRELLAHGMNCIRINCARDDANSWTRIIANVRRAESELGVRCSVLMDLAGPKIRTCIDGPPSENRSKGGIFLKKGDALMLSGLASPSCSQAQAVIRLTQPAILVDIQVGERIFFDDGKIAGVAAEKRPDEIVVEITGVLGKARKLREDRGINFPDSTLRLPPLTRKDLDDLSFVVANADLVAFSFIRSEKDIAGILETLATYGPREIGVVIKIENRGAFERLPRILLTAMRRERIGVLIARGDLAVECGFDRLAELQETILSFCNAAYIPVFWATEVLERLAKKGLPSRAEITDATVAARSACVMLNKGPHVIKALQLLDVILCRAAVLRSTETTIHTTHPLL